MTKSRLLHILVLIAFALGIRAQKLNDSYLQYIRTYADLAVKHMRLYHIPASITLAQGLLESAAGKSMLAVTANNHFGVKVGGGWTGPYVLRDDDHPNDKFRKYKSVEESYEDHSNFLRKPRYALLFTYDSKDYRSWATGLKACGYATNPTYAESLIRIIENYKLYEYDNGKLLAESSTGMKGNGGNSSSSQALGAGDSAGGISNFYTLHVVGENNKNHYIRVLPGDDLFSISQATGMSVKKLAQYNELPEGMHPEVGSVVYLKKKRKYADRAFRGHPHVVQPGQSMYDIAQMYGMRLKSLYILNDLKPDYVPCVGQALRVY